jgi:carbon-monoxide dehydrogenase iron sulfur subunit
MKKLYFDINKCVACRSCELICCVGHSISKDLFKAFKEKNIQFPRIKISGAKNKNFPVACRHCEDPKCVDACMSAALKKDSISGQVLYDKDRCVGCWMCVMVCPYGAVRPNKKEKLAIRCDLCVDIGEPQCAKYCPVKAIIWIEKKELEKHKSLTT